MNTKIINDYTLYDSTLSYVSKDILSFSVCTSSRGLSRFLISLKSKHPFKILLKVNRDLIISRLMYLTKALYLKRDIIPLESPIFFQKSSTLSRPHLQPLINNFPLRGTFGPNGLPCFKGIVDISSTAHKLSLKNNDLAKYISN